ncbi:MAG: DHH family phosphoesterase [Eubacteriales bacterium]|nr:DHH family phosphoesterase [Eubacteriales bacterium]
MNNSQIEALLRDPAGRVLIISHIAPDGDTLGSALALYAHFLHQQIQTDVCCQDEVPAVYSWLPGAQQVRTAAQGDYALALAIDCAAPDRMGTLQAAFDAAQVRVCIDHHKSNPAYASLNCIDASAAATAQIITRLLLEAGLPITQDMADCLYTGILTDSGQYSFDSTSPETLRMGAELVERGAHLAQINNRVFRTRSLARTRILGRAIENLTLECDAKAGLIFLSLKDMQDCGATGADTENLVNYALEIESVQAGVFLKETAPGSYKCSLRSSGAFDASAMAAEFGGGGHAKAAGFSCGGTPEEAKAAVLRVLRRQLGFHA